MEAARGDYLQVYVQQYSSGTAEAFIADSTSLNVDFNADALETTAQDDGLNASFIGGKVVGSISGDYLLATTGQQFTALFAHMNAGDTITVDVYINSALYFSCSGVLTNLSMTGGLSDSLSTGSYAIQLTGTISFA